MVEKTMERTTYPEGMIRSLEKFIAQPKPTSYTNMVSVALSKLEKEMDMCSKENNSCRGCPFENGLCRILWERILDHTKFNNY